MSSQITLYGHGTTRSSRCEWTLKELGLEYEMVDAASMLGGERLRALHPLAKMPAAVVDGNTVFESAAICNYFCDLNPEKNLIAKPGTVERAQHDQWCFFMFTEMEGFLWANAKHGGMYPEEKRVPAVIETNLSEFHNAAASMNSEISDRSFLVGDTFSVTDIIVGWTINWARRSNLLDAYPNLLKYVNRLLDRELCTFNKE